MTKYAISVIAIMAVVCVTVALITVWNGYYRVAEFSFAVFGDAPYETDEQAPYETMLKTLDAQKLAVIIHVGDLFWRPCTDAAYHETRNRLQLLKHALVYTPGDNEWTDCWEKELGTMVPLERLESLRKVFFSAPSHSLGGKPIKVVSQETISGGLRENVRWRYGGVVFATVHIVGSMNAMQAFPGRTAADDAESKQRTEAAAAWVRSTFAHAKNQGAPAVVLAFHANPVFTVPPGTAYREAFEPFLLALEEEVEAFGKPVLAVHGDFHDPLIDQPLTRRTTKKKLENFTRAQVPGSPFVGWARVTVTPSAKSPFAVEMKIVKSYP